MKTLDITVCMVECDTGPEYINIFDTVKHIEVASNTERCVCVCVSIRRIADKMCEWAWVECVCV